MTELVTLAPGVLVQPVVDAWVARPHNVAPLTGAMYLAAYQLKVLASFVEAPEVHAASTVDPDLRGGPFVALPPTDVDIAERLLERVRAECASHVQRAYAVKALDDLLERVDPGSPLDAVRREVPSALRTLVRVARDARGRALWAVDEPTAYTSAAHDPTRQAVVVRRVDAAAAAHAHSTPVVDGDGLRLPWALADRRIDVLMAARGGPLKREVVEKTTGLGLPQLHALGLFGPSRRNGVTGQLAVPPAGAWAAGELGTLLRIGGITLVIDPDGRTADSLLRTGIDHVDAVLVSHARFPWFDLEGILALRRLADRIVVPRTQVGAIQEPSAELMLRQLGFVDITVVAPGERIQVGEVVVSVARELGGEGDMRFDGQVLFDICDHSSRCVVTSPGSSIGDERWTLPEQPRPVDRLIVRTVGRPGTFTSVFGPLLTTPLDPAADRDRAVGGASPGEVRALIDAVHPVEVWIAGGEGSAWNRAFFLSRSGHEPDALLRLLAASRAGVRRSAVLGSSTGEAL